MFAISNQKSFGAKDYSYFSTLVTETEYESAQPISFALSQNYPNPFNPTTTIKYSIPAVETGHAPSVQLKVYDVIGNEIATLINEPKPAGNYEIEFDGSALTSGVYFYKITTDKFTDIKKMVLLR